jgi:hypothetical protein
MLVTHSRDIYVRILQNLKGHQSAITYSIPIYQDKPVGIPTIHFEEERMILKFTNPLPPQTLQVSKASYTPADNLYKGTSSPSCLPSSLTSGSGEVLS